MPRFHILITEEFDAEGDKPERKIERLSQRVDNMDIHSFVRLINTPKAPPRAPRSDAGRSRKRTAAVSQTPPLGIGT